MLSADANIIIFNQLHLQLYHILAKQIPVVVSCLSWKVFAILTSDWLKIDSELEKE